MGAVLDAARPDDRGKSKSCPWGAGSVLKKAKQAIKDFVYKMRLIDWSSKLSLGIPEETMGIITILMPPGSTVHDLKEKIMQWLEEISKEYGWNPPERGGCCSRAREGGLDPDQCNR